MPAPDLDHSTPETDLRNTDEDDEYSAHNNNVEQARDDVPTDDEKIVLDKEELRAQRECRIVSAIAVLVLIAVITAVSVVAVKNRSSSSSETAAANTWPPPDQPLPSDPQEELNYLRMVLSNNTFVPNEPLPDSVAALKDIYQDENQPPELRAASWVLSTPLLFNDQYNVVRRYALATLYYNNGGKTWANSTGWLTQDSHCTWYGVVCCSDPRMFPAPVCLGEDRAEKIDNVIELALSQNNVQGTLPPQLSLLKELVAIDFSFNLLGGTIPGPVLGSLPQIGILYLQHNQLTGTVPGSLRDSESLHALFVQRNNLNGSWPNKFCPSNTVLYQIGLDCDEIECTSDCCLPSGDCYRDSSSTNSVASSNRKSMRKEL